MKNDREIYIADLLSAYVGHPNLPVREAARALGISESLVYQHKSRDGSCPTGDQLLQYINILPDSFGNAALRLGNLTGAYRPNLLSGCKLKSTLHGLRRAGALIDRLSDAADDGIIDPSECRSLPPHVLSAASYLTAYAHHLGAGA